MAFIGSVQWIGDRDRQEDSLSHAIGPDGRALLVLGDGMGGHVGGDIASKLATSTALECLLNPYEIVTDALKNALMAANNSISQHVENNPETEGMGTTLVCAVIEKNNLWWSSVGDSHLYIRRRDKVSKLNADHSMAPVLAKMVEEGEITASQAANDPKRHALRSAITGNELELFEVIDKPFKLQDGDVIILCSDGVDSVGNAQDIERILSDLPSEKSADEVANLLLFEVKGAQKPRQDNTSILAATIQRPKRRSIPDLSEKQPNELHKTTQHPSLPFLASIIALSLSVLWIGYSSWSHNKGLAEVNKTNSDLVSTINELNEKVYQKEQTNNDSQEPVQMKMLRDAIDNSDNERKLADISSSSDNETARFIASFIVKLLEKSREDKEAISSREERLDDFVSSEKILAKVLLERNLNEKLEALISDPQFFLLKGSVQSVLKRQKMGQEKINNLSIALDNQTELGQKLLAAITTDSLTEFIDDFGDMEIGRLAKAVKEYASNKNIKLQPKARPVSPNP